MKIEKFHIYLADLNPSRGTEPGKVRPVVVVQTDLLNNNHPSTIICPLATKTKLECHVLRLHLSKEETALHENSDILIDQIRVIDNNCFKKHIGKLNLSNAQKLLENLKILIIE